HACGGLADLLHGGEQQADEDGDDRDHHQKLDQRERPPTPASHAYGHATLLDEGREEETRNHSSRRPGPGPARPGWIGRKRRPAAVRARPAGRKPPAPPCPPPPSRGWWCRDSNMWCSRWMPCSGWCCRAWWARWRKR